MKALALQPEEQRAFATAALALRYGERTEGQPPAPITAEQLNEPRRAEDVGANLWSTFQRVQENAIRGGLPGRTCQGRRMRTREVASIDRGVGLNRALWVLAEEMRRLKQLRPTERRICSRIAAHASHRAASMIDSGARARSPARPSAGRRARANDCRPGRLRRVAPEISPMKTLVLANQKGGVGKSAVATLLAHYLAQHGRRVLAIDLDHQGNFTQPLRCPSGRARRRFTADRLLTRPAPRVAGRPFVLVPSEPTRCSGWSASRRSTRRSRRRFRLPRRRTPQFDVCVVDTNPNPDIRLIAALASADFVLSPIQLNQEAHRRRAAPCCNHERVGYRKIKAVLNPKLTLIGLLPTIVEPTPFQRANFVQLVERHRSLMIRIERQGRRRLRAFPSARRSPRRRRTARCCGR